MLYHFSWNPWILKDGKFQKTSNKTFNKINKFDEPLRAYVGTEADYFDPAIDKDLRAKADKLILRNKILKFIIPTSYPSESLIGDNIWQGLKISDTVYKQNLNSFSEIQPQNRWLLFHDFNNYIDTTPIFRCEWPVHLSSDTWKPIYPCPVCSGNGFVNNYNIKWIVITSFKKTSLDLSTISDILDASEILSIPVYYHRAFIGGKLIREPFIHDKQYKFIPKDLNISQT